MTGPDRAWLYTVAALTGLRRGERRSLQFESFRFDGDVPLVAVDPAYTKNGQLSEQPIPPALAPESRSWLATKSPERPVFDMPKKTGL
jgi:integrase